MRNPTRIGFGDEVILRLTHIANKKRQLLDSQLKKIGLSRVQWQTLFWAARIKNCTQKDLLSYLDMDQGHLARVLESIEKENLITRSPVPDNRRCLYVEITDHAKKNILPEMHAEMAGEHAILFEGMDEKELQKLNALLKKIEINLENLMRNEKK